MSPSESIELNPPALVWGQCWRCALEVRTKDLTGLEGLLVAGLGLSPIARDENFVMLVSDEFTIALCLRRETATAPIVQAVRLMLMLANAHEVALRLERLGLVCERETSMMPSQPLKYEFTPALLLELYECKP